MLGLGLGGCAFQRAEVAQDARVQMVGMSKEQVLAWMGGSATKAGDDNGGLYWHGKPVEAGHQFSQ